MPRPVEPLPHLIVVTGLSGAGKSQAIHALEDAGYFCIDNLPVALIPTFVDRTVGEAEASRRVAVVVDVRDGAKLAQLPATYRALKRRKDLRTTLVYLEASASVLLRRFSETRRPHPLGGGRSASEGIAEERRKMAPIRKLADQVIETSLLSVHDLRRQMLILGGGSAGQTPLSVTILSFGFKRGAPQDADVLFDVRFLKNPYFVSTLRPLSGLDAKVARYVMRAPEAGEFLKLTTDLLRFLLPQYIAEGKAYLTVAVGCTGGRHRSVAIAEVLGRRLRRTRGVQLRVRHRDVTDV